MPDTCSVCGETRFEAWDYCPACQHPYVDDDDGSEDDDDRFDDPSDTDEGEFLDDVGWGP